MALQKFRDRQKTIYWIIAIIIIPSFMILGYSQVFNFNPQELSVGQINGKNYSNQEYVDFYKRIRGANFGQPVYFTIDNYRPTFPEKVGVFYAMALLEDAKAHGIQVTEEEVATYIKAVFGFDGKNEKKLEATIKNALKTVIRLDSMYEYKQAVREWLMIKKYLNLVDNSVIVPTALASLVTAQESMNYNYGKLTIPASKYTADATGEINNLSTDELKNKAQAFIEEHQNEKDRPVYSFLWTDPEWEFEYIAVPFVVEGLEVEVTDDNIKAFYESNPKLYQGEDGKALPLADVRDKVKEDYTRGFRAQTAAATLGSEYDRFLHRMLLKGDNTDNQVKRIELTDISADTRLQERGLKTGISGDKPETALVIVDNPVFTGSGLQFMLAMLDRQLRQAKEEDIRNNNTEATDKIYNEYKNNFRGFTWGGQERPFSGKDMMYKIRLISYKPGKPRKLDGKDGEDLLAEIKAELINQSAEKSAEKAAEQAIAQLKENKREIDGIEVEEIESSYYQLSGNIKQLRTAVAGDIVGPLTSSSSDGFDVFILYGKEAKLTDSNKDQLTENAKQISIGWRGNSLYTPEFGMQSVIKIGHRLASYLTAATEEEHRFIYNDILVE